MNRVILTVLSTVIITILVLLFNPQMPKSVQFSEGGLGLHSIPTTQNTDVKVKNIDNTKNSDISVTNTNVVKNSDVVVKNVDRDSYMQNIRNRAIEQYKKEQAQAKNIQPTTATRQTNIVKPVVNNNKTVTTQTVSKPVTQKKLTIEEETIAWNQWRANVANAITAQGHKYGVNGVELGTICKYSFNVNANKQISGITTSIVKGVQDEYSMKFANAVKSAIQSLNGSSILKFPEGTERKTVNVVGGIMTSTQSNYIDSSKFND